MQAAEAAFLYPHIDKTGFINCGLCANICPQNAISKRALKDILKRYTPALRIKRALQKWLAR